MLLPTYALVLPQAVALADGGTTVLCTNNPPVTAFNKLVLEQTFKPSDIHRVEMTSNARLDNPRVAKWMAETGFHTLTTVAVGARVMLTHNRDITAGAVNGATGVVTRLEYGPYPRACQYAGHPAKTLLGVHVRLDHTGQVFRFGRSKSAYFYDTGATKYVKSTFPLTLAYAMTGESLYQHFNATCKGHAS